MKPESKKWIEAAIKLAKSTEEKVLCPHCGQVYLKVTDIKCDDSVFERILYCPKCRAKNSMRMKR